LSEDTRASLDFLFSAWQGKDPRLIIETLEGSEGSDPAEKGSFRRGLTPRDMERLEDVCDKYVFRGVPRFLYTDNGSVVKSAVGRQVFERLGIEYQTHMPGSPRAKGSVESGMWVWERLFESRLRRKPARSLLELNVRALEEALRFQMEREHTRHGLTRIEAWARIGGDELRELPEDRAALRSLAMRASEERTIDYRGYIHWDGSLYFVADQGLWGKKALVGPDVFHTPDIVVECEGKKFTAGALQKDAGGFTSRAVRWGEYRSPVATATEKALKDVAKVDLNQYERSDPASKEAFCSCGGSDPARREAGKKCLTPVGVQVELEPGVVEREYGKVQAKAEVARRLGYDLLRWQVELIEAEWGTTVTESDINNMVTRLSGEVAEGVG